LRIFYATDVHGSELCFLKFLNAAKFYKVDTMILGGDITGKMIVPVVKHSNGTYTSKFLGIDNTLHSAKEVEEHEKQIRFTGYYPYRTSKEDVTELQGNPAKLDAVFCEVMIETLRRWVTLAEERLKGSGTKVYMTGGNDDRPEIEDVLKNSKFVIDPEGDVVRIDDAHEMLSSGWSNPTPWDTPRECSEQKLLTLLENMTERVQDMKNCVFNLHAPPYDSGLDIAPKLKDLKPVIEVGGQVMEPVGSTAVRTVIEKNGPLLGLHGHIHESKGSVMIGRTLCLNPGSEYADGILRGAVVQLDGSRIRSYQLTAG
jgi:Icc-related predicted phosphoesterase